MNVFDSTTILQKLKKENSDLFHFVKKECNNAEKMLDRISTVFKEYTDHGSRHSHRVLQLGDGGP